MTRKDFLLALPAAAVAHSAGETPPKLLIVVAHPDDEYAFAATTYRLTRELGWAADLVVITNGEAGYRYSALAEAIYGVPLTAERDGRRRLPAIRRRETVNAGKVLGIRRHYFLDQQDSGFSTDSASAPTVNWDRSRILGVLEGLMRREHYDAVFTLLPTAQTHGHHRAATLLALEAAAGIAEDLRPLVLGAEPRAAGEPAARYGGLPSQPLFRTSDDLPAFTFARNRAFGYHNALNYQIVVNWFIAEHKSQGLFQSDSGKHQWEQFWLFAASGSDAESRVRSLAAGLNPAAQEAAA
uniref:LmbE family protein n=1 Tax=Solibacter usitatus (strain Ellin6076) TaxID=234267 RepID=Q01UJ1_SOLUE